MIDQTERDLIRRERIERDHFRDRSWFKKSYAPKDYVALLNSYPRLIPVKKRKGNGERNERKSNKKKVKIEGK